MPSRVKLLNAAAPGTTGTPFKLGMGQPPYTIRILGGFTNGSGAVGTNGINIETSPDLNPSSSPRSGFPFPTAAEIAAANWAREIGIIGGENETETTTAEAVDLHDKTICIIQHYARWIRAKVGSNVSGTATVYVDMGR